MPSPGTANFRATLVDSQGEDGIADALLAAASPSASNPIATMADAGGARVIGPYPVAWNDARLNTSGGTYGPILPFGTIVLAMGLVITASFDGTPFDPPFELGIIADDNPPTWLSARFYGVSKIATGYVGTSEPLWAFAQAADDSHGPLVVTDLNSEGLDWYLAVVCGFSGSPSQGTANLYALVQYP